MTQPGLPFQAIALDLDGTLLSSEDSITEPTLKILRRLSNQGVQIILASGRMAPRIIPYAKILGIPLQIIAYNGGETWSGENDSWKQIGSKGITSQTRDAVFDLVRTREVFLNIYSEGKLYGYHPRGEYSAALIYSKQTGAEYAALSNSLNELPSDNIIKLLVVETPANRDLLFSHWQPILSPHCSLVKSNPEYLEFVALGVNKGAALSSWLAERGLEAKSLIAFGDAENDLEMLTLAGRGFAMANASPGLKKAYPYLSQYSHNENGVAIELSKIFDLPLSD